jgi:phenylalanyl-tRNA synthetase beta chain
VKVLLSWIREMCPTDLPAEELAERLTPQGVKVEAIEWPWERLQGVVVARVLGVRDHPDSDKLCLAVVEDGSVRRELVVGVRNMKPGDLVPLAGPGATVPALPEPLSARKIRGVVSEGMLCSPWELGISPAHTGILVLPPETPLGADFRQTFGLDDAQLDIEVKSNRPDLLSVAGVAREAAVATGVPFTFPDASVPEVDGLAADVATVEVFDLERCPRYLARIIRGLRIGPSPVLVQARLTASGMRPISNVVDATNYVMLELGQPLHPFDVALLEGPGIVVRRADQDERLVTLDDVERSLTAEDLLIADLTRAVAIAGVMGSSVAEVSEQTRDVLLESAYFERRGVARTSRRLGLETEASRRFERGTDPEGVPRAADRAARLMHDWAGGEVLAGVVEVGGAPPRTRIAMRVERASVLLGRTVTSDEAARAVERLGTTASVTDQVLEVEVPSHRPDLEREVDIIEEVARVGGYDRIGSTLSGVRQTGGFQRSYAFRRRVRDALVRAGLREGVSLSFASAGDLALVGAHPGEAVAVANPLAAEDAFLRTSLIPGLLRALQYNHARQVRGVALFEVGRVFGLSEGVVEGERIGVAMSGQATRGFPEPPRSFDFADGKGVLEALMDVLSVQRWSLGEPPGSPFHPARSARVLVGDEPAGVLGEVHPGVVDRLDLPPRTTVAELDANILLRHARGRTTYAEIPRFPPIHRDLAFSVDERTPVGAMLAALREAGAGLVDTAVLFDVFTGGPLPAGKKSVGFSVDFRAPDRTMTDEEAEAAVGAIMERLRADFGAQMRVTGVLPEELPPLGRG